MRVGSGKDLGQLAEPACDQRQRGRVARRQHRAVRCLAQRRELLELEQMVQVPEGFLLGDDGDVVLRGVGHQLARLVRRHRSTGECCHRRGVVGEGVLKVRRKNVDLVCRQRPNLALQKLHVGQRTARPVVGEPAVRHRRPVTDGRYQKHGVLAAAANQLLHRLRAVEKARRAFGDNGDGAHSRGRNHIAFVVHRGIELKMDAF